ncbi:MAG TPA: FHA domain-containing protein [Myxococcales bacterium]
MSDDRAKTPRTLLVPDDLWDALGAMAAEMRSDREALVNQALHAFVRLNGFLLPADVARLAALLRSGGDGSLPGVRPAGRGGLPAATPPEGARRVADLAQQLAASDVPRPVTVPPPVEDAELSAAERSAPADRADRDPGVAAPASRALVLRADGRELGRVDKDRYLIGRGKHCDLVIHSGKVSREHAAITRQGADYFIEDLGSSNGTWFDKRRITRRQIQEGDEYYISAEKLSCTFR